MRSIFLKLTFVFLLSAIIPLAISYIISIQKVKNTNELTIIQNNLEVAKASSQNISNYFQNGFNTVENLSRELEQIKISPHDVDHLLKITYANYPYFQFLKIVDLHGQVLGSSEFESGGTVSLEDQLPELLKGNWTVSKVYIVQDPPPVRPAISLFFPLKKNGIIEKILVAEINLVYAWHLVHQVKIGQEGEVFLVDTQGNIFASSNMAILFELKPYPFFRAIFPDDKSLKNKSLVLSNAHHKKYLISVVPLDLLFGGYLIIQQPTDEAFGLAKKISVQMALLAIVIMGLMISVGFWGIKKMVLSPVSQLTKGLKQVSIGNWQHRIDLHTTDEFAEMGKHYNEMTDKLQLQADQIRKQERLSLIGKIAGGLVHDLKHPISNIRNWTRLMPTKMNDPEFIDNFTSVVNREFTNVDLFFENLKDLTSDMPFNPTIFKIKDLLTELKNRFDLELTNKKIELSLHFDENESLRADFFLLSRVLSNLVSNAIQAVTHNGVIIITAKQQNTRTTFCIADNGAGIAPDRLQGLFEDFTTTKRKGLGLGLAISKKIIELHGGKIFVESKTGMGTQFTFWIPIL